MDHGCAQFFSGRFVSCGALTDGVRRAIGFDEAGMINGNVFDTLTERRIGKATRLHDGIHQLIGFGDRAAGAIDEM